ncbi:MAG: M24 family metallopeptidase [Eubacteriales bacterium]|nr:M24 family metallopeptidase [Eubacteriales bacterium]
MNKYKMKNRYEQVQVIGGEEMESRAASLWKIAEDQNCSLMLILDGAWEGYSHWIAGSRAVETVFLIPGKDVIAVYARDMYTIPYEDAEYAHIRYEREMNLKEFLEPFSGRKAVRIAVVQPEALTYRMRTELEAYFDAVEFVDCTQQVDVLKAIKSPEELKWIAEANRIHEQIFYALPSIIRPGRTIREINCETRYLGESLGGGGEKALYYAMQYGKDDGRPLTYALGLSADPEYRVDYGDRIFMMVEGNGYGGLYTALGRNFILGEPSAQTVDYWEMAVKAQDFAGARMKPGVRLKDIFDANYAYIQSMGYRTNMQNYLHSFGYVFGERPYLHDRSETETLRMGMHYIVHPHIRIDRGDDTGKVPYDDFYSVDTYYVTEDGGQRANAYPRELVIL